MRILLSVLGIVLLASCGVSTSRPPAPKVALPDTPQGQECAGNCEQSYHSCDATCGAWLNTVTTICHAPCAQAWQDCLVYCPGAHPL